MTNAMILIFFINFSSLMNQSFANEPYISTQKTMFNETCGVLCISYETQSVFMFFCLISLLQFRAYFNKPQKNIFIVRPSHSETD